MARTAAVGTVLAAGLSAWVGGPASGLVVLGAAALVTAWAGSVWWPSLVAVDRLSEAADSLRRGSADAIPTLPGPAARVVHAVRALQQTAQSHEREARSHADRLDAMMAATPTGMLVLGEDGRVERTNDALRAMLSLTRPVVGRLPVEVLNAVEILEVIDTAHAGPTDERPFSTAERDLAVSAHPMQRGTMVLVRDMTAVRMAERARTDFVANVSHELRTPIAAILGYSEALLADAATLPPDAARMVGVIDRHGHRLHRLFEDLLTLHKIEARREALPRDTLILAPVVADAVAGAVDLASAKQIDVEVDVASELVGLGNREAVTTIVRNLAGNAVKYTPSGGSVRLAGRIDGEHVCIDVIDTGPGIPAAQQDRVFERFYRVDDGRSRDVGGVGLGLAIVKHLAEASACEVRLRSVVGEGSTFTVRLPRGVRPRPARRWDATLDGEE